MSSSRDGVSSEPLHHFSSFRDYLGVWPGHVSTYCDGVSSGAVTREPGGLASTALETFNATEMTGRHGVCRRGVPACVVVYDQRASWLHGGGNGGDRRAPTKQKSPVVELLQSFLRQFTISVVSFEEFAIMRASFVLTHQLDSQFDFVSYVLDRMQVRQPGPPPCICQFDRYLEA